MNNIEVKNFLMNADINNIILENGICYDNDDYDLYGFTYYSLTDDSVHSGSYGHGDYSLGIDKHISIDEIAEKYPDIVDDVKSMIKTGIIKYLINSGFIGSCYNNYELPINHLMSLPCSVNRGRKMKGDNLVLVKIIQTRDYFNRSENIAIVVDPEKKQKCKVSLSYVELNYDIIKNALNNIDIDQVSFNKVTHYFAYKMSYASCDTYYAKQSLVSIIEDNDLFNLSPVKDIDTFDDPWEAKLLERRARRMNRYFK